MLLEVKKNKKLIILEVVDQVPNIKKPSHQIKYYKNKYLIINILF